MPSFDNFFKKVKLSSILFYGKVGKLTPKFFNLVTPGQVSSFGVPNYLFYLLYFSNQI